MTRIPKTEWGDGPWQNEPDDERWIDKATGLQCIALRHPFSGHWCGYVAVTAAHPAYRLTYWLDLDFDPEKKPDDLSHLLRDADDPRVQGAMTDLQRRVWQQQVEAWAAAQGRYPIQTMVNNLTAHGGLTWARPIAELSPDLWCFGFDCAHAGDLSPGMRAYTQRIPNFPRMPREYEETYRTLDYVRHECHRLARQLADIEASAGRVGFIDIETRTPEEIALAIADTVARIVNQGTA